MNVNLKLPVWAFSSLLLAQTAQAGPVFINELHYDNAGSDKNEFVELMAPANTDLNGWALEFYNGGNGRRYMSWALSGVVSNQSNGWGVLSTTGSGGIQNGAPDGIALVDNLGVVQQFLSYEGSMTAQNGSAVGMSSIDIGLSESGSTPLGVSLQLSGAGQQYSDFSWVSGSHSSGSINAGQTLLPINTLPQNQTPHSTSVSEPGTLSLGLLGLSGLLWVRRRGGDPAANNEPSQVKAI